MSFFYNLLFTALECYELGHVAFTNKDFYYTLMWMDEALDHLNREPNNTLVRKVDILEHIAHATAQVDDCVHLKNKSFLFITRKYGTCFSNCRGNVDNW